MTESLFLRIDDGDKKDAIVDALKNEISYKKKCSVINNANEKIAEFSKYDVLSSGITFFLEEPIQDNEVKEYKKVQNVVLGTDVVIKKDKRISYPRIKALYA